MIKLYSQKVLDQIKENYMVGILATKEDALPYLGDTDEPVTYSQQMNDVIFYIKPLSQEPKEISEAQSRSFNMSNLYIGFGSRSISNLPNDIKYDTSIDKKIEYIQSLLQGKLLLFKPLLKQQEKNERYHKNIEDVIPEEEWMKGVEYSAVPKMKLSPKEFEAKLLAEEAINLDQYNHAMPAPHYVLCGDYIYGNIKENQWRIDSSVNHNARVITSPNTVKRVKISEEEKMEYIGSQREYLVFFDSNFMYSEIADRLDSEGVSLGEWIDDSFTSNEEQTFPTQVIEYDQYDGKEKRSKQLSEIDFIRDLEAIAKAKNLVYSREDLINFHTSIKSSAFTILSGQSGIGKTKLATLYGEALGLNQKNKTMLIMPISPAYTEPADILGYLNPATGLYIPVETGLVEFLLHAEDEENINQLHMLIMDEMNLSQIEHYFAPFISLLELDIKERFLHLYSKDSVCHNNQKYKHSIQLKNNLVIVGTMNADETTKDLSDRLLDRSNVVVLEKRSFIDIKKELELMDKSDIPNSGLEDAYGEVYMTWKSKKENWKAFEEQELEFFDNLDKMISDVDSLKGFSIRNLIRMGAYLNNLPIDSQNEYLLDRKKAIDLFIKQRVITKIRGPIEIYEDLIGTLESHDSLPNGELFNLFSSSDAALISDFDKTKKELIRKARELSVNGYAT